MPDWNGKFFNYSSLEAVIESFFVIGMEDLYRTVEVVAEGLYKEKGSKFLAFVYPVATEEQIREIIAGIKADIRTDSIFRPDQCTDCCRALFRGNQAGGIGVDQCLS